MRQIYPPGGPAVIATVRRGDTSQAAQEAVAALAELYAYPAPVPASAPGSGPAAPAPIAAPTTPTAATSAPTTPWVRANMVASADGAGSLNGLSGGLSGPADRLLFSVLRSLADVILVGAATARAEKYRPAQPRDIWPQLRAGRAATPPIAVVTSRLDLDLESQLLAGAPGDARTIVLTTGQCPDGRKAAASGGQADVIVAGADRVTPAEMLGALAARGYHRVLIEGGPSLLAQVTAAGLLDELCLTISPLLEGGTAGRIIGSPPPGRYPDAAGTPGRLTLAHILEDDGFLLSRYLVERPQGSR